MLRTSIYGIEASHHDDSLVAVFDVNVIGRERGSIGV